MIRLFIAITVVTLSASTADAGPIGRLLFGARSSGCDGGAAAGCAGGKQAAGCSGTVTTVTTTKTYRSGPMSHSTPPKAQPKKRSNSLAPSSAPEQPSPVVTAVIVETRRPGLLGRLFGRRPSVVVEIQR